MPRGRDNRRNTLIPSGLHDLFFHCLTAPSRLNEATMLKLPFSRPDGSVPVATAALDVNQAHDTGNLFCSSGLGISQHNARATSHPPQGDRFGTKGHTCDVWVSWPSLSHEGKPRGRTWVPLRPVCRAVSRWSLHAVFLP